MVYKEISLYAPPKLLIACCHQSRCKLFLNSSNVASYPTIIVSQKAVQWLLIRAVYCLGGDFTINSGFTSSYMAMHVLLYKFYRAS